MSNVELPIRIASEKPNILICLAYVFYLGSQTWVFLVNL
jgi:hypothetical protein